MLALIGLALGVSNRKDGKLASFVLGFGVIFVYYVLLWTSRAWPSAAGCRRVGRRGFPTFVLGVGGRRPDEWRSDPRTSRSGSASRRSGGAATEPRARRRRLRRRAGRAQMVVIVSPHLDLPRPQPARPVRRRASICGSSSSVSSRCSGSSTSRRSWIWPTSCFADGDDGHAAAVSSITRRRSTSYYVIPMAVLVATLVTVGLMTKNSELS